MANIAWSHEEFGHRFQVERLKVPDHKGHVGFLGHLHLLYEDAPVEEYDRRVLMREIRSHNAIQKKIKTFLKKMFTPPLTFGKTSGVNDS